MRWRFTRLLYGLIENALALVEHTEIDNGTVRACDKIAEYLGYENAKEFLKDTEGITRHGKKKIFMQGVHLLEK